MTDIEEKLRKISAVLEGYHNKMLLMALELATTEGDNLDQTAKQHVIGGVTTLAGALHHLSHQLEILHKELPEIRKATDFDESLEVANFLMSLGKKKDGGGKPN